jgi:hypothetical protein
MKNNGMDILLTELSVSYFHNELCTYFVVEIQEDRSSHNGRRRNGGKFI